MYSDFLVPKLQLKKFPSMQRLTNNINKLLLLTFFSLSNLLLVNGITHNTEVAWRDLEEGEWSSYKLVVVLQHQVLWAYLEGGHIGVLNRVHHKSVNV